MAEATVTLERRGPIAVITLDQPERRNAFSAPLWDALDRVLDELEPALPRVVVITGAGDRAFSAGFDVNPDNPLVADLIGAIQAGDETPARVFLERLRRTVHRFVGLPVPIIAAVNGLAYGGGAELATQCDLRVMDPAAVLCFSEVKLGLMPDWGGGPALARLLGPGRAADLILTARKVGAEEALQLGWANRVSAPGACLAEALDLGEAIAKNGPRAVRATVALLRAAGERPYSEALDHELGLAAQLIASGECVVGVQAFLAGVAPDFPDPERDD